MNKKKIFTLTGIIATIIALGGTAVACHFNIKKNSEQNNNKKQEQPNNPAPNAKKENITVKTMYGIPMPTKEEEEQQQSSQYNMIELVKYAVPPMESIETPNEEIKKQTIQMVKYAVPPINPMYSIPDTDFDGAENSNLNRNQNPWK